MLRNLCRIAFLVGLLMVIALSVIPQEAKPDTGMPGKLNHIAAYAALALAGGMAYSRRWPLMMMAAGLLLLGAGLEFVQAFLPSRFASSYDMLANVVGIALGATVAFSVNTLLNRRPQILSYTKGP